MLYRNASRPDALRAVPGLSALCCLVPVAQADIDTDKDLVLTLGSVAVSAAESGPLAARNVLGSVGVLGGDVLQTPPVNYSWELFSRVPGVMLTEFNQGTTSGKISFRGFNGEGEVNAVKLLIDGIPSNSSHGNMPFLDMVFPLDIDSIEVVRGTSDLRYGLNNIASNVNVVTRTGGDYGQSRGRYGSFNTREMQISKGIESPNWAQNYFFAYQKSGGYRDHARTERYSMAAKWFYTPDEQNCRVGLIYRHPAPGTRRTSQLSRGRPGAVRRHDGVVLNGATHSVPRSRLSTSLGRGPL